MKCKYVKTSAFTTKLENILNSNPQTIFDKSTISAKAIAWYGHENLSISGTENFIERLEHKTTEALGYLYRNGRAHRVKDGKYIAINKGKCSPVTKAVKQENKTIPASKTKATLTKQWLEDMSSLEEGNLSFKTVSTICHELDLKLDILEDKAND
jgi:hypothetical protein